MVFRNNAAGNVPPVRSTYDRAVARKLKFMAKVAAMLRGLETNVNRMSPDYDPTTMYTDPDESRLTSLDGRFELLDSASCALAHGDAEEADDLLRQAGRIAAAIRVVADCRRSGRT